MYTTEYEVYRHIVKAQELRTEYMAKTIKNLFDKYCAVLSNLSLPQVSTRRA